MKYKFYSRNDKNKEAIGKVEARSYKEAINYFVKMKQLPKNEFLKLFLVTEIK